MPSWKKEWMLWHIPCDKHVTCETILKPSYFHVNILFILFVLRFYERSSCTCTFCIRELPQCPRIKCNELFFLQTGQSFPQFSLVLANLTLHILIRPVGRIKNEKQLAHNDVIFTKITRECRQVVNVEVILPNFLMSTSSVRADPNISLLQI